MSKKSLVTLIVLLGMASAVVVITVNHTAPIYAQEQAPTPLPTSPDADRFEPGEFRELLQLEPFKLRNVAFSPDSQLLAVGSSDGIRFYDTDYEQVIFLPEPPLVTSVSWSPDGQHLAASSWDGTIWVWQVNSQEVVTIYTEHSPIVRQVTWSPDGALIASGSAEEVVRIWQPLTGETQAIFGGDHYRSIKSLSWNPQSTQIAVTTSPDVYHVWDVMREEIVWAQPSRNAWTPIAVWGPVDDLVATTDPIISLRDSATGEIELTVDGVGGAVSYLAWSPDGTRIASNGYAPTVIVWDVAEGQPLMVYEGFGLDYARLEDVAGIDRAVNTIDWSPDGERLAAIGDGTNLYIWDMNTYELLHIIDVDDESPRGE